MDEEKRPKGRVPVKEGLFPWPLPGGGDARLMGSRCDRCEKSFFPKRPLCPECREEGKMREVPLSATGRLYSYTIVRQGPPGFRTPYATALVDLPEGIRLFSQLTVSDPSGISMGGNVKLTFGPIAMDSEGNEIISYLFEPMQEG